MRRLLVLALLALACCLAASGCGGDESGSKPSPPATTPVADAHKMATTAADVPDPADDPAEPERSARRSGRLVAAYVERWAARFAALPPASVHGAYGDGLRRQLTYAARAMRGDARALRGPQAASTAFLGDRCRALTVPLQEVGPRWRRLDPPSSLRAADAALMDAAGDVMLVLFECYRRAAPGAPWDVPDVLAGRAARRAEREYARAVRLMRVA